MIALKYGDLKKVSCLSLFMIKKNLEGKTRTKIKQSWRRGLTNGQWTPSEHSWQDPTLSNGAASA